MKELKFLTIPNSLTFIKRRGLKEHCSFIINIESSEPYIVLLTVKGVNGIRLFHLTLFIDPFL